jgi:hypothetical protein
MKAPENGWFVAPHEILMGREVAHPLSPNAKMNLDRLLIAVNRLRALWGKPLIVSSGYRPAAINKAAGGAKASHHLHCAAVDFRDPEGLLARWLISRLDVLEACALWMEDPQYTKNERGRWVHCQIYPPKSGARIFKP